jgi:hypothetical protein
VTGRYVVGAFVGNECRGIGKLVDNKVFLTVYGTDSGEPIAFRAFDPETGNQLAVRETILFGDALLGSLERPYEAHITGLLTGLAASGLIVDLYPNPVDESLYLELGSLNVREIRITAMDGKLLYASDAYSRKKGIDVSRLLNGTYLLSLLTDEGTLHRKFIKMGGTK